MWLGIELMSHWHTTVALLYSFLDLSVTLGPLMLTLEWKMPNWDDSLFSLPWMMVCLVYLNNICYILQCWLPFSFGRSAINRDNNCSNGHAKFGGQVTLRICRSAILFNLHSCSVFVNMSNLISTVPFHVLDLHCITKLPQHCPDQVDHWGEMCNNWWTFPIQARGLSCVSPLWLSFVQDQISIASVISDLQHSNWSTEGSKLHPSGQPFLPLLVPSTSYVQPFDRIQTPAHSHYLP